MTSYLRTPGQSAINYGLGTLNAARPKGLFFVRFRSPMVTPSGESQGNAFGFVVKNIDQPKITAKTEELTQYNKKRVIHTGYDLAPVNITLIDTLAGTARKLWQSYMSYHFGDFRHTDIRDWRSDQINNSMFGDKIGYGYQTPDSNGELGEDGKYYFDSIEIIQVYAATFTKVILVNPRIQSFDPDVLDYEEMGPSTFRMSLIYESVMYQELTQLSSDQELMELFGQPGLEGDLLEVEGLGPTIFGGFGSDVTGAINDAFTVGNALSDIVGIFGGSKAKAGIGGVLSQASSALTFGSLFASNVSRTVADVGSITSGKQTLGSLVNGISRLGTDVSSSIVTGSQLARVTGINATAYDSVRSLVTSRGTSPMREQIVNGVLTANQINGSSPNITTASGLDLSDEAMGIINASRSASSQIGKRRPLI
jgi:hypothetical protein